ncbi:hypothetical protein [Roseiconus lacunae]|uniref:hypothetical protein n=1 Tax=Roseiconus lacunae TaxID=2605694 RepID=UPI0011F14BDC|nr:hypothetical protein [Roseiconus lacunae]
MPAIDVTLAKAMVTLLGDAPFSNAPSIVYARNASVEKTSINKPTIYVDGSVEHVRIARDRWGVIPTLRIIANAPQGKPGDDGDPETEAEKDAWLEFIDDELLALIRNRKVDGRKAKSIRFMQRLGWRQLRQALVFQTSFLVTYPLS